MKLLPTKKATELSEYAVTLVAEDPEDMWHAYNLILPGDILKGHAIRNVVQTTKTGSSVSERVHTMLSVRVEATFWDPSVSSLQVKGRVVSEQKHVSIGQFHTLDLEVHRAFTLDKPEGWDSVATQTLRDAIEDDRDGAVAAVVMDEGIANICLVTQFRTVLKQRVEKPIPGKRSSSKEHSDAMRSFFALTLSNLMRVVRFDEPRPLLLASPGFVAANFKKYLADEAVRGSGDGTPNKTLAAVAASATVVHAHSGFVHSLNEVLRSTEVTSAMNDMKFARETRYIEQFYALLRQEDGRAWYGAASVLRAVAEGAVGPGGVLLVNNSLFRSHDLETRKKYVALVDKVRADGGEARVLSSDHESGRRLGMLGDVAAILTYPMVELDEEEGEEEEGHVDEVERPVEGSII